MFYSQHVEFYIYFEVMSLSHWSSEATSNKKVLFSNTINLELEIYNCNPSTGGAKAEGSRVQGKHELLKTLSQKNKRTNKNT